MGKTRDLSKKIGDTMGTFPAKMGTINDRKGKDLTKAKEIKKSWQEYIGELYKTGLNDLDNHDAVITHLEPDILECKVKWDLGSITMNKVRGGDGILCACTLTCFRVSDTLQHYGPWPMRLLCPWHYPGKNIGVGCHSLLQGFFLTLGLNPCLLCLLNWQMGFLFFFF